MRKFLLISFVSIMASACTVKTLYNKLDWFIVDYIDDYVELSSEQQITLYKHLDDSLHWHRTSQLPVYVNWLQDFKLDVQSKLSYQKIAQNITNLQSYFHPLMVRTAGEMAILLPDLTALQQKKLYASMTKKNNEFAEKFIDISREEQLEIYIERMEDRFKLWLGSVTEQQGQLIKVSAVKFKTIAPEVLKTRRLWQAELKTVLEKRKDISATSKAMHDLFVNSARLRSDNYKKMFNDNQQTLIWLIVDVANTMTKEQQQYFYTQVEHYSKHFTELAEEARTKLAS